MDTEPSLSTSAIINEMKEFIDERLSKLPSGKEKFQPHVALKFKGNQMQYDFNGRILNKLHDLGDLVKAGSN